MGKTVVWDQLVAGMPTEQLFRHLMREDFPNVDMEQFLIQCLPTKNGEDWSKQLARELGVSSMTVRNYVEAPDEKKREKYLAIAVCLKMDVESANQFLTKMAKVTRLYARNVKDTPYLLLLYDRARFERERPRIVGESIPDWVRRVMPECFLENEADALYEWLRPFLKRKGWKLTQLANDIGVGKDELRHIERRCFAGSRKLALAVAESLGMTEEETNCFLSMCWEQPCLGSSLEEKGFQTHPNNTEYYKDIIKHMTLPDVKKMIDHTSDSRTSLRKALPIFQEWIGDTERDKALGASSWLSKNAGNRRWRDQGFQSREVKKSWDKLRRAIEADEKPVSRDELIRMGLMLRMDLGKTNEVLSVCGYREIHSNNGNIFEYYLFHIWSEFSDYFYNGGKMPEENLNIDTDRAIPDLQLYFSQRIDHYFKPMKEYLQKEKERQREYQEAGKQPPVLPKKMRRYQKQQKNMPGWYLAKEARQKRYSQLRAEAIGQALREYPRIRREEERKVQERLLKIKREGFGYGAGDWKQQECDESFARQELEADGKIFDLTLEGSIDYSLEAWGFETLGENNLQKAADLQLARKLDRLPERPDEKQVETLYSLVQCLYGKG